ncbi:MAG: S1-like domain-containing RNA-binding protein [Bacteroidales bacterium]|jgi:predicted RNA-binding protein (virulence factor B family)|nr:S1-like domain-containing RNA-binding protein [Bacteroidales bacterium]
MIRLFPYLCGMQIGLTHSLKIARETVHGFYLEDENGHEVLLPGVYITEGLKLGDMIRVFLYKDSENRIVATTENPAFELGEFAFLRVKELGQFGAFVDWGLPKDLLVPFSEQISVLKAGESYPFCLCYDEKSDRLFGSARINKQLDYTDVQLEAGQEVDILIAGKHELGISAIIEQRYSGLIFHSDIHKQIQIGEERKAYVKQVREDGKVDLLLEPMGYDNSVDEHSTSLLNALEANHGKLELSDKSAPESIKTALGMSKKAFKKALGKLYKAGKVEIKPGEILLKK